MTEGGGNAVNWIVGGGVALLGVLGLFLASGAKDLGIGLFGYVLFGFAVLFDFALIRRSVGRPRD